MGQLAPQLVEATGERIVADDGMGPEPRHEVIAEHDLAGILGH